MRNAYSKCLIFICAFILCLVDVLTAYAQKTQGIGTNTPNPRAVLELNVEDPTVYPQGFLPPRLTTVQRMNVGFMTALGTVPGMTVFDMSEKKYYYWNGSTWKEMAEAAAIVNFWTVAGSNLLPLNSSYSIELPTFSGVFRISGSDALKMNSNRSIFLANAGNLTTTGTDIIFVGSLAGALNHTGSRNNFFGFSAGKTNISGSDNNFFGSYSGNSNTSGFSNNFLGYSAGSTNTIGNRNNFFGEHAGFSNTNGSNNNFIGYGAGHSNISGSNNIFLGNGTGNGNTSGSDNIAIGRNTGFLNGDLTNAIAVGVLTSVSGSNQVVIGHNITGLGINVMPTAMLDVNGGARIRALSIAGSVLTVDGLGNVGMGNFPIISNEWTVVGSNIRPINNSYSIEVPSVVGALKIATQTVAKVNSNGSLYIGDQSGNQTSTAFYNLVMGYQAGQNISTGAENIIIGYRAGNGNITGFYNSFIGRNAGFSNTGGQYNHFFGYQSGYLNQNGSNNVFIGRQSGYNNVAGSFNVILGDAAGFNTSANDNILIGRSSGYENSTGISNIFIGSFSGIGNTTGNNNIALGRGAGFSIGNLTNAIVIGMLATATGSNQVVLGNNITGLGINTNNPTAMLDVNGGARIRSLSVAGSVLTVDGLGNIGMGMITASSQWVNTVGGLYYSDGNVGIGLVNPVSNLHLHQSLSNSLRFTTTSTGSTATDGFAILQDEFGKVTLKNYESDDVVFETSTGGKVMFINSVGSVGINNSIPGLAAFKAKSLGGALPYVMLAQSDNTSTPLRIEKSDDNSFGQAMSISLPNTHSGAKAIEISHNTTGSGIFLAMNNSANAENGLEIIYKGTGSVINAKNSNVSSEYPTVYFANNAILESTPVLKVSRSGSVGLGLELVNSGIKLDQTITFTGLAGGSAALGVNAYGEVITLPGGVFNNWMQYNASSMYTTSAIGIGKIPAGIPLGATIDLLVVNSTTGVTSSFVTYSNSGTVGTNLELIRSRETTSTLFQEVQNADKLGSISFMGATGTTSLGVGAELVATAIESFTIGKQGTTLDINTALLNEGFTTNRLKIASNGGISVNQAPLTGRESLRIGYIGSTPKGMVVPYVTTAQMAVLTSSLNMADQGMFFWNTDSKNVVIWDGTKWQGNDGGGVDTQNLLWSVGGNSISGISFVTATGYGKIGTNENYPIAMVVNNQPRIFIDQFSNIKIGDSHVFGTGTNSNIAIGTNNTIIGANNSLVFGNNLASNHLGSILIGDFGGSPVSSTQNNQMTMRFTGGYRLLSVNADNTKGLFISNDKVGVNITNPSTNLQVNGELGLGDGTETGNKPVVVWLRNNGPSVGANRIVIVDASLDNAFNTTTTEQHNSAIGVVLDPCNSGDVCRVAVAGIVDVIVLGTHTRGQHCVTSTVSGEAKSVAVPNAGASIGVFITSGGPNGKVLLR